MLDENIDPELEDEDEEDYDDEFSWSANTSIFVLIKNIEVLKSVLDKYIERQHEFAEEDKIINSCPEDQRGKIMEQLSIECINKINAEGMSTLKLYSDIKAMIDSSILMACISLEFSINCFCHYNLGEECCEAVERLSTVEKMIVCNKFISSDNNNFKGTSCYQAVRELNNWRNKYAHGKATEENPLKLYDHIKQFIKYMQYYLRVKKYMSENDISGKIGWLLQDDEVGELVSYIKEKNIKIIKDDFM